MAGCMPTRVCDVYKTALKPQLNLLRAAALKQHSSRLSVALLEMTDDAPRNHRDALFCTLTCTCDGHVGRKVRAFNSSNSRVVALASHVCSATALTQTKRQMKAGGNAVT
jgi:hypothetical protein